MTDTKTQQHTAPQSPFRDDPRGTLPPGSGPARREPRDGDDREIVVINQGTTLSAEQRHLSQELRRLYESLAGNRPGEYWPQALLDTAGRFNRPSFPGHKNNGGYNRGGT